MKLTQTQRNLIIEKIVYDINERQTNEYYSFSDELTIQWCTNDEEYRVIPSTRMQTWSSPKDIILYIQDLSDKALIEYYVNDTFDKELEDL